MTIVEAARLLEIPPEATPEQIEAQFHVQRQKLEDRIAKAPTPGLKAKYRESLDAITQAFETLTLAADSSDLPVLKKEGVVGSPLAGGPDSARPQGPPAPSAVPTKPKSGGKEFILVALIAVAVLAVGGWWVLKTKRENEERALLEAALKAEAAQRLDEQRQDEEAEQDRRERLLTSLRSRMAGMNVAYDAQMRAEQAAERELSDLRSKERDLTREQKGSASPELRRLSAQTRAQERFVTWMRETLPAHPARVAKARAEEMISARAADDAAHAVEHYASQLDQLKRDLAEARARLAVTGPLRLTSNLSGTRWQLTDAFGTPVRALRRPI